MWPLQEPGNFFAKPSKLESSKNTDYGQISWILVVVVFTSPLKEVSFFLPFISSPCIRKSVTHKVWEVWESRVNNRESFQGFQVMQKVNSRILGKLLTIIQVILTILLKSLLFLLSGPPETCAIFCLLNTFGVTFVDYSIRNSTEIICNCISRCLSHFGPFQIHVFRTLFLAYWMSTVEILCTLCCIVQVE